MNTGKRPWLIIGVIVLSISSWFVGRVAYVLWHIPEAYAAWDAGDMLLWYMRTHDNEWPDDWAELQSVIEDAPALLLRGRHPEEPDYMGRMRRTVKIDWTFDPANPRNPTPVTRLDGSPLQAYWSDPNGMIYQYLDRQKVDQRSDGREFAEDAISDG
ncbi:hypothetical protein [Allorhodopirellula solitaria]|uniref:Uncharacterized protein n=1 Tax=Allorhodopirellula solitaria TaxID=2527987 RepID=A0A5C5XUT9_9BACT|nr:hypothetical protein [Allorhodopirellula solitaria]TWT66630.1 hypothetical protein CA85_27270 [Allorhodopirellula solitaria]